LLRVVGKPTPLADGDIEGTVGHEYRHGDRVKYICQNHYIMQGDPYKTCTNGEWIGQMRCLSKTLHCDYQDLSTHNIDFRYTTTDKRIQNMMIYRVQVYQWKT
ncbi:hypothetical protein F7725_023472, partial [Dissostichus mawsoni]